GGVGGVALHVLGAERGHVELVPVPGLERRRRVRGARRYQRRLPEVLIVVYVPGVYPVPHIGRRPCPVQDDAQIVVRRRGQVGRRRRRGRSADRLHGAG